VGTLNFMAARILCDICFQTGLLCERATDATKNCQFLIKDASSHRLANGTYSHQLGAAAEGLRGLTPAHVDSLLEFTPSAAGAVALTAAEQAIFDSKDNDTAYDGLNYNNLHDGVSLARKKPIVYAGIQARMESILGAASQAQVSRVEAFLRILSSDSSKVVPAVAATTATAFKEITYPLYQLWISISKKAIQGQDLAEETDAKTMFDPTVGRTFVPFDKVPKFKTPGQLFRAFSLFKEAVTVLFGLAPRAWAGFETTVFRTEAARGFLPTQQYIGEVLRRLDAKEYSNIGTLLAAGEHNRILDDVCAVHKPLPVGEENTSKNGGAGKRIKLAEVTKEGEFASLVRDQRGTPLICNQFKSGQPCKAGVAPGQGYDEHVGKCAYHHPTKSTL
jgi:hypothetical protein